MRMRCSQSSDYNNNTKVLCSDRKDPEAACAGSSHDAVDESGVVSPDLPLAINRVCEQREVPFDEDPEPYELQDGYNGENPAQPDRRWQLRTDEVNLVSVEGEQPFHLEIWDDVHGDPWHKTMSLPLTIPGEEFSRQRFRTWLSDQRRVREEERFEENLIELGGSDNDALSPEYLALVEQYTSAQPQQYAAPPRSSPPPRRLVPGYSRQQQQLQQAYHNQRVPAVAPPRPRLTLHSQAEAQAEAQAEYQAHIDAQNRAEANARLRASATQHAEYQVPAGYSDQKLGTFEQELLQLVSANQAQEFKHQQVQPKRLPKPHAYPQYSQQLLAYSPEYAKPTIQPLNEGPDHQQYHVETTQPRYQAPQHVPVGYQPIEEVQYQPVHQQQQYVQPKKAYKPQAPQQYIDPNIQHAQAEAEAQAVAHAQAEAQAQALAFQKISQASHNRHQQAALEQIRIVEERYKQQSALEQINQGHVSEAGREHIEEQLRPKDPEEAYRARLKAQAAAEAAEARRIQEASEFKAHGDAIIALQKQQAAHLKAQEDAHNYALNFEKNQAKAQAQAQAIANAQALALWKAHQGARAKAQKEAQLAARAQDEARKRDPEHTPVIQYLLPNPNSTPLPLPNTYLTSDQVQKYQASGSSYVPRSAPRPEEVNQPRQAHKHKVQSNSQIYVSQSGLLKKAPVKSLTVEEIIEQDQDRSSQIIRIPAAKAQPLTQADLDALIHAGYTVTPVPDVTRPTQQPYALENTTGYYVKKQPSRPDGYSTYDDVPHPRRAIRKQRPILKQENNGVGSDKVTYLVPLEPVYGTRRPPTQRRAVAEE